MTDYSVLTGNPFASLHTGMASGDEVPAQNIVTKADKDANRKKKADAQTQPKNNTGNQGAKNQGQPQGGNQKNQKGATNTNTQNQGAKNQGAKNQGQPQGGNQKNQNSAQGAQQSDNQSQGQQRKKQKFVPIQANIGIAGPRTQDDRENRTSFSRDNNQEAGNSGDNRRQGGFRNNNRGNNRDAQSGDNVNSPSQGSDEQGGFGSNRPRNNNRRNNQDGGNFDNRRQGGFNNQEGVDNRRQGGFRRNNNQEGGNFGDNRRQGGFRNNRDNQDADNRRQGGFRNNRDNNRDNNRERLSDSTAEQGPLGEAENSAFNAPTGDMNSSSSENFNNFAKEGAFGQDKRNNEKNRTGGFAEGDRQISDFRGRDARFNRANDHGSSERSFQRREAAGFQRRDGSVRGDGARHDRRPKNAYHRTNGGQRNNTKGGAGGHNWGAEGSEVNDAEFAEGRSPTVIEAKVTEGQGITEADTASPLPEGASAPATPAVEGEKKEGEAAAAGADKKDNKTRGKGEESDEEPDNTVSYEEYTKKKAESSKGTLPKLPEPRRVEAGEVASGEQIKRDTIDELYGAFVPRAKEADKKKSGGEKKKKAVAPAQPELNLQFEIRDTSRDGRGGGRGGRGRGGDRDQPRSFNNSGRGGRGGRGGRVDFGNKSFPSLSPASRKRPAGGDTSNNNQSGSGSNTQQAQNTSN